MAADLQLNPKPVVRLGAFQPQKLLLRLSADSLRFTSDSCVPPPPMPFIPFPNLSLSCPSDQWVWISKLGKPRDNPFRLPSSRATGGFWRISWLWCYHYQRVWCFNTNSSLWWRDQFWRINLRLSTTNSASVWCCSSGWGRLRFQCWGGCYGGLRGGPRWSCGTSHWGQIPTNPRRQQLGHTYAPVHHHESPV
jgi:hypothetical protein